MHIIAHLGDTLRGQPRNRTPKIWFDWLIERGYRPLDAPPVLIVQNFSGLGGHRHTADPLSSSAIFRQRKNKLVKSLGYGVTLPVLPACEAVGADQKCRIPRNEQAVDCDGSGVLISWRLATGWAALRRSEVIRTPYPPEVIWAIEQEHNAAGQLDVDSHACPRARFRISPFILVPREKQASL